MADVTSVRDRRQTAEAMSTRKDRLLAIETPLGKDTLVLTELIGEEEISKPFAYVATMRSEDPDIEPESLIGSKVTMWIAMPIELTLNPAPA